MHTCIHELPNLKDVLDDITAEDDSPFLDEQDEIELVTTCLELMHNYIDENPYAISEPDFEEEMMENIKELYKIMPTLLSEDEMDDFEDVLETSLALFYTQIIPMRSYCNTFAKPLSSNSIKKRLAKINYLRNKPQPEQRTPEWYLFRHNLITASNAYKAFENEVTRNQLIYEKCQPLKMDLLESDKPAQINIQSPFHWGQKYEPVSVMYYEDMYKTKIGDYGCIQHDTYSFLGASPDGINIDETSNRFGRLLEIKNIVNREIDGIPKKEYWIQMQLQMETCDLDECDFLECRFSEYAGESEFYADGTFCCSEKEDCKKGVIMYFCKKDGNPKYVYMPFSIQTKQDYEIWEQETMQQFEQNFTWIKNIYWKLDEVSCVLVLRNKIWFQDTIGKIEETWNIIEKERVSGFQHRASAKRTKKTAEESSTSKIDGCFLAVLKENSEKQNTTIQNTTIQNTTIQNFFHKQPLQIVKIRTESFDETKKNM